MRSIMAAKTLHDSSFSFSRRYFNFNRKKLFEDHEDDNMEEILTDPFSTSMHFCEEQDRGEAAEDQQTLQIKKKKKSSAVSKIRSALSAFVKTKSSSHHSLGTRVVIGTLFGYRRGHVHFAIQEDSKQSPAFLIELATPTSVLVREMASGLVRIVLECEKKTEKKGPKLLQEPVWRTYCNGKKCGYALRRDCGPEELKTLKAVEPISMGAGVLPGPESDVSTESEGALMYMRARFERVAGGKDSEAFYMVNPDCTAGPELSVYLLRV